MTKRQKLIQWTWLSLLLLTPIILWLLPSNFFDESKLILCPSRLFFNVECPGCGMTRAVMHLHHLELEDAIYFNPGSVAIYPALVAVWLLWVVKAARQLGIIKGGKKETPAA
ncbi:MAG: DUF2752 domain-containing protein [Saprospiraceae bacterium]|nr:MAG: DUF2752 domain-containing protein [Saprospiraceae bacterium]